MPLALALDAPRRSSASPARAVLPPPPPLMPLHQPLSSSLAPAARHGKESQKSEDKSAILHSEKWSASDY